MGVLDLHGLCLTRDGSISVTILGAVCACVCQLIDSDLIEEPILVTTSMDKMARIWGLVGNFQGTLLHGPINVSAFSRQHVDAALLSTSWRTLRGFISPSAQAARRQLIERRSALLTDITFNRHDPQRIPIGAGSCMPDTSLVLEGDLNTLDSTSSAG
jgi:hypothetical protein